jgi:hypothetical protein
MYYSFSHNTLYIHIYIYIGNSNTVGGGLVPPLADLGTLAGLEAGGKEPVAMIDGMYIGDFLFFHGWNVLVIY